MKPTLIVAALFALSSLVLSQRITQTPALSKEYIDIMGVRLRLGMTKADVAEKFVGSNMRKAGYWEWDNN